MSVGAVLVVSTRGTLAGGTSDGLTGGIFFFCDNVDVIIFILSLEV